jgi:hypothetical protein
MKTTFGFWGCCADVGAVPVTAKNNASRLTDRSLLIPNLRRQGFRPGPEEGAPDRIAMGSVVRVGAVVPSALAKAIPTCDALAQLFELLLSRIFFFLFLLEPLNRALHLGEQIVDGRVVVEDTNLELRRILDEVLDVRGRRARQWYAHRKMS